MKTIDEAKAHCRFVGEGIEKAVADGDGLSCFGDVEVKVFRLPRIVKVNESERQRG